MGVVTPSNSITSHKLRVPLRASSRSLFSTVFLYSGCILATPLVSNVWYKYIKTCISMLILGGFWHVLPGRSQRQSSDYGSLFLLNVAHHTKQFGACIGTILGGPHFSQYTLLTTACLSHHFGQISSLRQSHQNDK